MRADLSLTSNLVDAIRNAKETQDEAIQQLSSGKRLRSISDDPAAAAQLIGLHSSSAALDAYTAGTATVRARFAAADSALATGVQLATRAVSLAVSGSNGTVSAAERQSIASELQGVQDQLLATANSQFNGRYLFSGEADSSPAFASVNGAVTYQGSQPATVEIADGVQIANGQAGNALFGSDGSNIFDALSGMIQSLSSNSSPQNSVAALQSSLNQLITKRVSYGSAMSAMDDAVTSATDSKQRVDTEQNQIDGADMTTAASALTQAQVAQSAASAAFSKVASMSLFDYLPR